MADTAAVLFLVIATPVLLKVTPQATLNIPQVFGKPTPAPLSKLYGFTVPFEPGYARVPAPPSQLYVIQDDVRTHTRGKPGNPMGVGEEHYHWRRCVFLLMLSLAIFFLLQSRTHGYLIFVGTAVVLAICAVLQVSLDGVAAGFAWQLLRTWVHEGISGRVVALGNTFTSVQDVRQNTLAANSTIADFLFITNSSAFTVLGCLVSLHKIDARIVYIPALITNTLLLGFTERTPAGRILWKGRQESLVMDCRVRIPRKHNTTVEIILESSLLYLICDLIYVIAFGIEKPYSAFGLICWGSLAQLVNVIPMIIIIRAAVVKNLGATHAYHCTKLGTAVGISAGRMLGVHITG
ncbi:hypothetical protein B0H14DRAFT_2615005 [Mycena olivaceomarginata]|nr:hypothetical protein B0H14DRAFT_2615005 [Mycena olivaceomarginata]